jgi:hypothetical protein
MRIYWPRSAVKTGMKTNGAKIWVKEAIECVKDLHKQTIMQEGLGATVDHQGSFWGQLEPPRTIVGAFYV